MKYELLVKFLPYTVHKNNIIRHTMCEKSILLILIFFGTHKIRLLLYLREINFCSILSFHHYLT